MNTDYIVRTLMARLMRREDLTEGAREALARRAIADATHCLGNLVHYSNRKKHEDDDIVTLASTLLGIS